ncbi:mediator of RNA polymerase II transcription subunit 4 [Monosporozyma unispora]|nr:Mediator of RNA polymerase II transcription subunit 4 [Kazachstania unispora]
MSDVSKGHIKSSSVALISDINNIYSKKTTSHLDLISKYGDSRDEIKDIDIYNNICSYEDVLNKLVESVDKYKPDIKLAQDLIEVDKKLYSSLQQFQEYDKIDTRLKQLNEESQEVDEKTKNILDILNECHDQLNNLPTIEQVEFEMNAMLEQRKKINSKELLDYATKLSKFTKVPPTFDKGSIGPNNFIWPAEDSLRRGMLAMANLHASELTKVAGKSDETSVSEGTKGVDTKTEDTNAEPQREAESADRRESFVFGGNNNDSDSEKKNESENDEDAMDLDLDLFNPDDF